MLPRSIHFAITQVDNALDYIAQRTTPQYSVLSTQHSGEAQRATRRLRSELAYGDVEEAFVAGLHEYLVNVQRRCYVIGEHIQAQYFAHRALRAEEVIA